MSDPLYKKFIVVPTNQCNYHIYEVYARHAISTTGLYHIDGQYNKESYSIPSAYKKCLTSDQVFDTRGDAEQYAQSILMPKVIKDKIKNLQKVIDYYSKRINDFTNKKHKCIKFEKLIKENP